MNDNATDYTDDQRKILDAIKASSFSVKDISLTESALAAFKNSGVSMDSFKIRQDIVDSFKGKPWVGVKFDKDDLQLDDIFDQLMMIHHAERMRKMSEQAVEQFHQAMASLPNSKVVPVTLGVSGKIVGRALIDPTDKGFCILHAVIDGQENVAALLKGDETKIFIGDNDDFKKES